jgi:hypothetical protein
MNGRVCHARVMSNDRDLVEVYIMYQVWPLSEGWTVGEIVRPRMSLKRAFLGRCHCCESCLCC